MTRRLPPLAVLLGAFGLVPFLACGTLAVSSIGGVDATLGLAALVGYGAVILSFLGAVHWGFALEDDTRLAERARLSLGVLPALLGWVALLALVLGSPAAALALLVAGFLAVVAVEQRGAARGVVPRGWMAFRWALTVVVVATLGTVLVMRSAGLAIAPV